MNLKNVSFSFVIHGDDAITGVTYSALTVVTDPMADSIMVTATKKLNVSFIPGVVIDMMSFLILAVFRHRRRRIE